MTRLSIVVPVYNEAQIVRATYDRLSSVLKTIGDYELIMVDDGSRDATFAILRELAGKDPSLRLIRLSRNFGHQVAISAGMAHATGEAVVVIDGDLQDPPEVIPALIKKWEEGFDVVYGVRSRRKGESAFKLWTARLFYRFMKQAADIEIPIDTGDFRLMSRRVVDHLVAMRESHRFIRGMVSWIGFSQIGVEYVRDQRLGGVSKYSLRKMWRLAFDGIASFTRLPLQMLWTLTALFGLLWVVVTIGWGSDINQSLGVATIWACSLLSTLMCFGFACLGLYVGRMADEVRERPLYIVQDKIGW